MPSANSVHKKRPSATPIGTPTTTPTTAATEDCQATEAASCRWVNPSAFRRANCAPALADRRDEGEPERADRAGGQDGGEERRGRADGAVVRDLGRAQGADHAADRRVGIGGPVEHRRDAVEGVQRGGVGSRRADGDEDGHGARDRAALLVEVGGGEERGGHHRPGPHLQHGLARPADRRQRRRPDDAQASLV